MIPDIEWHPEVLDTESARRELSLRTDFIREQWTVNGPGQLVAIAKNLNCKQLSTIHLTMCLPGPEPISDAANNGLECRCPAYLHDLSPSIPEVSRVTFVLALAMIRQSNPSPVMRLSDRAIALVMAIAAGKDVGIIASGEDCPVSEASDLWKVEMSTEELRNARELLNQLM